MVTKTAQDRRTIFAVCVFLAAITWLVFGQTLAYDFVNYDDQFYVYENPIVTRGLRLGGIVWAFIHSHSGNWHPLTTISHMLDCQLYELEAGGHHFTNVLLHTIAVLLLFLVLRQMTGVIWPSAFVAALFAIHPLHVESVAWIAERKDVLSGVFFMLTLGAYVYYAREPTLGRYALVSILFLLGLMSKPMLVTVPFVLVLLDYWPLRRFAEPARVSFKAKILPWLYRQSPWRLIMEKIPLLVLCAASCLATLLAQRRAISSFQFLALSWRIENALVSYVAYVWQMLDPVNLAVFYPHPESRLPLWEILFASALLVALTRGVFVLRKQCPYLLIGWLWYLIMLVPVIGLLQVGIQARADRYTYLPQIGLYVALTWAAADCGASVRHGQRILGIAAVLVIAALSWDAWIQTSYWKDSESLWNHALAVTSKNSEAHKNLAAVFMKRGQVNEAVSHYNEALVIHPEDVNVRDDLGVALIQLERPREAVAQWKRSLAYQADDGNAQRDLAWVLATAPDASLRDGTKAVDLAEHALRAFGQYNPLIFRTLAAAYAESGRFADAIDAAKHGLALAIQQKNAALADEIRRNIALYEANSPLRDNRLTDSHAASP